MYSEDSFFIITLDGTREFDHVELGLFSIQTLDVTFNINVCEHKILM